jgi:TIR domain
MTNPRNDGANVWYVAMTDPRGGAVAETTAEKPGIFISDARSDSSALAEELVAGLELAGFRPFLDRHDIAAAEDWEARLGALILGADTVVFILLPAAVRSERCASADGARVATGSWDNRARLCPVFKSAQALADSVRTSVPRCLTPMQREAFHLGTQPPR